MEDEEEQGEELEVYTMPRMPKVRKYLSKDEKLQHEIEEVCLEYRKAGSSYSQIAKKLSKDYERRFFPAQIKDFVERGLGRLVPQEDPSIARSLQVLQIDQLILSLWPKANGGDIAAAKQIERFMERKAKLIDLDAVKGTQNSTTHTLAIQSDAAAILERFKDKDFMIEAESFEDEDQIETAEMVEEEVTKEDE